MQPRSVRSRVHTTAAVRIMIHHRTATRWLKCFFFSEFRHGWIISFESRINAVCLKLFWRPAETLFLEAVIALRLLVFAEVRRSASSSRTNSCDNKRPTKTLPCSTWQSPTSNSLKASFCKLSMSVFSSTLSCYSSYMYIRFLCVFRTSTSTCCILSSAGQLEPSIQYSVCKQSRGWFCSVLMLLVFF